MSSSGIQIRSTLPLEECVSRLSAVIDADSIFADTGSKPVLGSVTRWSVSLRKRISGRNSFQTRLTGTFRAETEGTSFHGKFGIHPVVRLFQFFWFGFLGYHLILIAMAKSTSGNPVGVFATIAGMMFFGVGLEWYGRKDEQLEIQFLGDFVKQVLGATISE